MGAAQKYDTTIEQGADYVLRLVYKDAQGAVVDLSLHSARMQVREAAGGKVLADCSTDNGRIVCTAQGELTVSIPYALTSAMTVERCVYDLFLYTPDNVSARKLLYGNATVQRAVTR